MRLLAPVRRSTFLVLLGAALVSVALTVGVAVRAPVPTAADAPAGTARSTGGTAPPEAGTFEAVAGPACPVDATHDLRISAAWEVVPGHSWTGDGCGDRFLYSPPADVNYLRWQFTVGAASTCRVAVFVPDSPLAADVVWYGIGDRPDNPDHRVGGFALDQGARRGEWVEGPRIPVRTGKLVITVRSGQNRTGVTAAPARVAC